MSKVDFLFAGVRSALLKAQRQRTSAAFLPRRREVLATQRVRPPRPSAPLCAPPVIRLPSTAGILLHKLGLATGLFGFTVALKHPLEDSKLHVLVSGPQAAVEARTKPICCPVSVGRRPCCRSVATDAAAPCCPTSCCAAQGAQGRSLQWRRFPGWLSSYSAIPPGHTLVRFWLVGDDRVKNNSTIRKYRQLSGRKRRPKRLCSPTL